MNSDKNSTFLLVYCMEVFFFTDLKRVSKSILHLMKHIEIKEGYLYKTSNKKTHFKGYFLNPVYLSIFFIPAIAFQRDLFCHHFIICALNSIVDNYADFVGGIKSYC